MPCDNKQHSKKSFKKQKTIAERKLEVETIRTKYPNKVPVIVESSDKEKELPELDKTKFLLPQELTIAQFVSLIRNRMLISSSQTFFLFVNKKTMVSMSTTLLDLYTKEKDEDGFLYFTYASQDAFGGWL